MILLVSAHFPPEPVVAACIAHDLARTLSEKLKVTIITPRPSRPLGFSFKSGSQNNGKFEHVVLRSYTCPRSTMAGRMMESYSFGRHASRYIRKNHQAVKVMYILAWPLLAQYQIVRTAKKYSIPTVTHIVDIYPESLINKLPVFKRLAFSFLLPMDRYILQNSSRIITISQGMKRMLAETRDLDASKVEIVYTWQNDDVFLKYNRPDNKSKTPPVFTFMFLGSLSPSAALENVILAFVKSGMKNTRLIIAGNGSEKENLMDLVRELKNKNIEFWDAPAHKVPDIQDQADVLILSLKRNAAHFAMPSKLPAYMFSKKPIIASVEEDSDIALVLKNSNCGWVVKPEDPDELGSAMAEAMARPEEERCTYGENGYQYAMDNFSRDRNLNNLVSIIEQANETWL